MERKNSKTCNPLGVVPFPVTKRNNCLLFFYIGCKFKCFAKNKSMKYFHARELQVEHVFKTCQEQGGKNPAFLER